jgi:uncharacterized protein
VDLARQRISLTMKLDAQAPRGPKPDNAFRPAGRQERGPREAQSPAGGAMAAAFAKLKR